MEVVDPVPPPETGRSMSNAIQPMYSRTAPAIQKGRLPLFTQYHPGQISFWQGAMMTDSPQFSTLKPTPAPVRKASRAWPHLARFRPSLTLNLSK
jgi:hypothetical protein